MNKSNLFMKVEERAPTFCSGCGEDIPPGVAFVSGIDSYPGFSYCALCFDCVAVANSYRIANEQMNSNAGVNHE